MPSSSIISINVDILITAAIPDLIKVNDVNKVKAKLIVEGSNIPMDYETESLLNKKGILVIPDFVANAGGVISSYVEYIGGSKENMFKLVKEKIIKNTKLILEHPAKKSIPRDIALKIARERIEKYVI